MTFTPAELEELRRFDAEVDAAPMEYEDFLISELIDDLLFPEQRRKRERSHQSYERCRERCLQYGKEYRATHQEEERARKQAWYQANRERVAAQQKAYHRRKAAEQKNQAGG